MRKEKYMIHQYKLNGYNIVLDVCSGSVHVVDEAAYDLIGLYENTPREAAIDQVARKYPELDAAYIRRELTMLRVAEFYNNILRLMDSWFNGGEANALTDFMTDFIISSGSWGQHNSRLVSVELRDSVSLGSIRAKRIRNLLFVLFPPAEIVAKRYPAVEKHPWLLPVFWPVRWITALLFRRDRIRNEKEYQQAVAADQLKARREALKHVGLDFQF